jgi:hypothetical protein
MNLVETKSYQNHLEALGACKGLSSEYKKAVKDDWVQEFMAIALPSRVVLMKAKVDVYQPCQKQHCFVLADHQL